MTDVSEVLIGELRKRAAVGMATYGVPLTPFNGRDALEDALEEGLDLCVYLTQLRLEWAALKAENARLTARIGVLENAGSILAGFAAVPAGQRYEDQLVLRRAITDLIPPPAMEEAGE